MTDIFKQAEKSQKDAKEARRLAEKKQFREAVKIAEEILSSWSNSPNFWEKILRHLALGDLLDSLRSSLQQWRRKITEADNLAAQAEKVLKKDTGNPLESELLATALKLYQQCNLIIHDDNFSKKLGDCQHELNKRIKFQKLIVPADEAAEKRFFKLALKIYFDAQKIYNTADVEAAIAHCSSQIVAEETYEKTLNKAEKTSKEGKLRVAISLLEPALTKFPRSDGIELLEKIQKTLEGKEKFRAGLLAEKEGNFFVALNNYREAKNLFYDVTECQIRLAILEIKTQNWETAVSLLKDIEHEQAKYLRGFALAQQGYLEEADREWQSLSDLQVKEQRDIIAILAERDRLLQVQEIEQFVDANNLDAASTSSIAFIQKNGNESLVKANLELHIKPRIQAEEWQNYDWKKIAIAAEQNWRKQLDITSLHNWAVATYYRAQIDANTLEDWIVAGSAALANISIDPSLKDLPWISSSEINLTEVTTNLKQLLEKAIDTVKDRDIERYFKLRDIYRLESTALNLMGNHPTCGIRVNNLFLTPSCYQRYQEQLQAENLPGKLWGSLYTNWGLAVAACLEGDTARAIQIKAKLSPINEAERFAVNFISYHEGCHYLQQQRWRDAVSSLQAAKLQIKTDKDWQNEIDRLCNLQRQAINYLKEHLEFAQFWYDLLDSKSARSYLAEYKAEAIREKLAKEKIKPSQALKDLEQVKKIDPNNPVVNALLEQVEIHKQLEEIEALFKRGEYEQMVNKAKYSRNARVKYIVAEFLVEILVEGVNNSTIREPDLIRQLGRWAYEICPNEPAFQEVYRSLGLRY
ncbi:hypothetical protein Cri9333_4388 [Crinalium epipsammum PCC 9333]|uniref:Peptidase M, neutral zinc metallopeptidase site n=1 Tax=Crinalium epipsammum PCC 9333 TaxID=1173022 RepID=K9W4Q5_9CYAN|nr:hypothetical protein [Crinalium epipsammum]AFZ15171.1 hypothetical protein Cri9333_4388 [Crinalium epipsammum PCC 9333]